MFSAIWAKIREIVAKMVPRKSVEEILHVAPIMSDKMADAIQLWADMYEGHSPWLRTPTYENPVRIVSLGLPSFIASEKARMATLEMKSKITAPYSGNKAEIESNLNNEEKPVLGASTLSTTSEVQDELTNDRVEFLNKQYKKVLKQIRRQLEYGIAKGGLIIKPYIVIRDKQNTQESSFSTTTVENRDVSRTTSIDTNGAKSKLVYSHALDSAEIEFDFIQADRFFPLTFDANGKVVEAAFVQTKVDKAVKRVYIRLEYHKLEGHKVIVKNFAYESQNMGLAEANNIRSATHLGTQIPLEQVPEWANLQETTIIEGVDRLLFAYFRMPEANTVDPYSPLGVSGYSRVIQLIKDADMQYSRMLWEFEGGELAIDVDRDALKFVTDKDAPDGGYSMLPEKQQRLFRKVDLNNEETYNVFAPAFRDASLINGLNSILMRIEDATGLSRGTISDVNTSEAKTATELKILKQRSFATNADIQASLQDALEDTIYVMDVYATLYDVTPDGEYEVSFEWDDSILVDSESELSKRLSLMQNGIASKLETRMWYFGESESQARAALSLIDEESIQAVARNIQAEQLQSQSMNEEGGNTDGLREKENSEEKQEQEGMRKEGMLGSITKSAGDTTSAKKSAAKQADNLENPNKAKNIGK